MLRIRFITNIEIKLLKIVECSYMTQVQLIYKRNID